LIADWGLMIADCVDCGFGIEIVDCGLPLNQQSPIRNLNQHSESTISTLNRQSAISKSAIANPQSAIRSIR
jgi:hypothetical protein